ncbi:hypothetical protein EV401DRAFT_2247628, partial [Pisolithus croceorrhizus]
RLFLGSPFTSDLAKDTSSSVLKTTESILTCLPLPYAPRQDPSLAYPTAAATSDEAGRRISLLYQNIIFKNSDKDGERIDGADGETQDDDEPATTFLTRPPGPAATQPSKKSVSTTNPPSFPLTSESQPQATYGAQDTAYSEKNTSSVTRFPNFQFNIYTAISLSSLRNTLCWRDEVRQKKVNVLVAVLVVEGVNTVYVKSGLRAGQESPVFKRILGDEEGCVCQITA